MNALVVCLALVLATTVSAKYVPFRNECPDGLITDLDIKECDGSPCTLKWAHNVTITVNFKTSWDELNPTYTAFVAWGTGMFVNWDVMANDVNPCPDTPCPITKGVSKQFTLNTATHAIGLAITNAYFALQIKSNGTNMACAGLAISMAK